MSEQAAPFGPALYRTGSGVCRFCGCTDAKPCQIGILVTPRLSQVPWKCSWIDVDHTICSSPDCVLRAYRELVTKIKIMEDFERLKAGQMTLR